MKKITYKAVFLYEEFNGLNLLSTIKLLQYNESQIKVILFIEKDGIWEIGVRLKNNMNDSFMNIECSCDFILKAGDYIAYDNGKYKKVDKHYIDEMINKNGYGDEY